MKTKLILLGVAVFAVLGAFAAINLGGTESSSAVNSGFKFQKQVREGQHPGHPADAASIVARAGNSAPKVKYLNSKYYSLGPQAAATFWMSCPKGWKAINGYFFAKSPGLVLGSSFPSKNAKVAASKKPKWNFGVLNFNGSATVKYYTGIVCMKGLAG